MLSKIKASLASIRVAWKKSFSARRFEDFVAWYKKLRQQGKDIYGENQVDVHWYAKYNMFNCACWAWYNSKHYTIDGIYK